MSMGWMTAVATMPAEPPFMNGSAARIIGVCKKSIFAAEWLAFIVSDKLVVASIASAAL